MDEWHKVTKDELQTVNQWLESHLPESWQLYGMTREIIRGMWKGQTFYAYGWPVIRGVVNGEIESDHLAADFIQNAGRMYMYAPKPCDAEAILKSRLFFDWGKDFMLLFVNDQVRDVAHKVAEELGHNKLTDDVPLIMLLAEPGDVKPRPIPDGFKVRRLNIETDLEYCKSVWQETRVGSSQYFATLFRNMPTMCLAESSSDECVSFAIGTECGVMRFVYTKEEYRGKGLASTIVSHFSQEYFKVGLPCVLFVYDNNDISLNLHKALGFKRLRKLHISFYESRKKAPSQSDEDKC